MAAIAWTDASGSHSGELHEPSTCGSAAPCAIVIADRAVSRIHVELAPREDGLWAIDLGSRNGTYVNGVRIAEARIPSGAILRVGTTDITVSAATSALEDGAPPSSPFDLVAATPIMRRLFASAARLAKTDGAVLIEGEEGTGKKTLARAIHDASPRASSPFVVMECTVVDELSPNVEEVLRSAAGGTLVLDEPADLPVSVQQALAAKLEARDFRVVATTSRDLRPLVNLGAFVEGLYFILADQTLRIAPLRARPGDVLPLLRRFLGQESALATETLAEELRVLPWMGNARELRHYADRLRAGKIARPHEPPELRRARSFEAQLGTMEVPTLQTLLAGDAAAAASRAALIPPGIDPWFAIGFKEFRERWIELGEHEYLRRLMARTNRSSGAASREAGLERTYLYRLIKKHGV